MTPRASTIAVANQAPWNGVGATLTDNSTISDWAKASGLDWAVATAPVQYVDETGETRNFPDRRIIYRADTGTPFAMVSDHYKPVQPAEVLELMADYTENLKIFTMETAGTVAGGKRIWGLARSKDSLTLAGEDKVIRYLLMATSFDRSIQTVIMQTSLRVVCGNMLAAAMGSHYSLSGNNQLKFIHSATFTVDLARQRMALNEGWADFRKHVETLAAKKVGKDRARKFFASVLTQGKAGNALTSRVEKQVENLMQIYVSAPGQEMVTAKGTFWGAVNAITYYADHDAKERKEGSRFDRAQFGDRAVMKDTAMKMALAA
jgi:phage/plasmid-like protein (TIGR03299 family)